MVAYFGIYQLPENTYDSKANSHAQAVSCASSFYNHCMGAGEWGDMVVLQIEAMQHSV